ncbi:MAG: acylneuraminate cytidylyltransferase [Spirochaetales bacterium]|nr:acylneuraminate cytidylyltransferase [Spirochaetales bacterium]
MIRAIFLAARLDSRRLPGKALLPVMDKTLIGQAMSALKKVDADVYALLTDEASASDLSGPAACEGFTVFIGPKDDVLKRYALAAEHFRADLIVRATGDNPLVSPAMTTAIMDLHSRKNADLSHFTGLPVGTGVEVITRKALDEADLASVDPYEREHITTHLYNNRDKFVIIEDPAPPGYACSGLSLTVDTEKDYRQVLSVYGALYKGTPLDIPEIIALIEKTGGVF